MEENKLKEINSFTKLRIFATENNVQLEGRNNFEKFLDFFRQHPEEICKVIWESKKDIDTSLEQNFDEMIAYFREEKNEIWNIEVDFSDLWLIHKKTNFGQSAYSLRNASKTIRENLIIVFKLNIENDTTDPNLDFSKRINQYTTAKTYILSL